MIGMVSHGSRGIDTRGEMYIGATLMGITNDTVMQASNELTEHGKKIISFHSTGIGGKVMEDLIREGIITAVMALSLHELTAEYFGGYGYSRGCPLYTSLIQQGRTPPQAIGRGGGVCI